MKKLIMCLKNLEQKYRAVIKALNVKYPEPKLALQFTNPFDLLVAVILSAQCSDERVNAVTKELFRKVKTPQDILKMPINELEMIIRPTGYYRQKAKNLKACCESLVKVHNGHVPADIEALTALPGVGRKTAAMVLGNAFGINQGIAVDTHVKRVVQRIGLSSQNTPEKIERELMKHIQQELWTWFSNAMILHGRNICKARRPECSSCCITEVCSYRNSEAKCPTSQSV